MLKKVILVSTGRYYSSDQQRPFTLTPNGLEDARWLGQQIVLHELKPEIVFYTAEICCMHTALLLAEVVGSVKNHAGFPIIGYGLDESAEKKGFWKDFRFALRTPETARAYLGKTFQISEDVEEVAVVSMPGFGGVFADRYHCVHWCTPIVYEFDFATQELSLKCNVTERFGCV
jgi:broad specificity phosphatase PhoE